MKAIILAAGIGSRLGKPHPKTLTPLSNGKSILGTQIDVLKQFMSVDDIYVVVGFKKELIMEEFPDLTYIYNNFFDTTNTSQSLLKGLKKVWQDDVLWLNGDVVFDERVLEQIIEFPHSSMAVNTSSVSEEEVKYRTNERGLICEVSKSVEHALGEAVGINCVRQQYVKLLIDKLELCDEQDYFERGIELAISSGLEIYPVDISTWLCHEIDFEEDLRKVNERLATRH